MEIQKSMPCPLCKSSNTENILNLNCGRFDGSALYQNAVVNACANCGHVYNQLSSQDVEGLMKYYNEEYAPLNMAAPDSVADRPGSASPFSIRRYTQIFDLIKPFTNAESHTLDIGCAMGGFLDYLFRYGFRNLSGIDLTEKYIEHASKQDRYTVKMGHAESIPFSDNSFDCLIIDQVLEHLIEPIQAFKEARRVLREGGYFCVAVPDASRYEKRYFFDFYWFIMREHIQHFDIEHLNLLAGKQGFELVGLSRSENPMMSASMVLQNLNVIFKLTDKATDHIENACFNLPSIIKKYIAKDCKRLTDKRKVIEQIRQSQKPIHAWGIGREFLYLYEEAGLKHCNIDALIDTNPYKQMHLTLEGKPIRDPSVLKGACHESVLFITAFAHEDAIRTTLRDMDYQGDIVSL